MPSQAAQAAVVDVYAGDTTSFYSYTFKVNDVPQNLTDWTWSAQWRLTTASPDSIALVVDSSQAATGTISVYATAAATSQMTGPGVWDLQGVKAGQVRTWLYGITNFTKDVTHA